MNHVTAGQLTLSKIIERKLAFLLNNDIAPWEGKSADLGERDALQQMLEDATSLSEQGFEAKYMAKVMQHNKRMESKTFSVADNDDYDESFNNTVVTVLALINPVNLYCPEDEG